MMLHNRHFFCKLRMQNKFSNLDYNNFRSTRILVNTNTLNAVAKNKKEAGSLDKYCRKIDKKLNQRFYEIEKENYECKTILSGMNGDLNQKINDEMAKNTYFRLMRLKSFDPSNSFLPSLLKSVAAQEKLSSRSVVDMIDYTYREKHSQETNNSNFEATQTDSVYFEDYELEVPYKQRCVTSHPAKKKSSLLSLRCKSSYPKLQTNTYVTENKLASDSTSSFKSVRREKQDIHFMNNLRDTKFQLLKKFKNGNEFSNMCSKRCFINEMSAV